MTFNHQIVGSNPANPNINKKRFTLYTINIYTKYKLI